MKLKIVIGKRRLWSWKVLLIVLIYLCLEICVAQQGKKTDIDLEQFLQNIRNTIEKIIKSSRKRNIPDRKKRDRVRKQLLQKLAYPHLSRYKPPSHYIINPNIFSEQKSITSPTNLSNPTVTDKISENIAFEDKIRATLKNTPSIFPSKLSEFKKMFESINQKIKSNTLHRSTDKEDKGKQQDISSDKYYLNEVKDFMLSVLRTLGSYWYRIKIMFIDNSLFFEKWKEVLCPCIASQIFTNYYIETVFKNSIKSYSTSIHIPLVVKQSSKGCHHSICLGLNKLAKLTADKQFSRYLSRIDKCITAGALNKPPCFGINNMMYSLYYRANFVFKKFQNIVEEIILPSYLTILASSMGKIETNTENIKPILAIFKFNMIKEQLNQTLVTFIFLQEILKSNSIIEKYDCINKAREVLLPIYNKYMAHYSSLIKKMESVLFEFLYKSGETLRNDYITHSNITAFIPNPHIVSTLSRVLAEEPEKLYEILDTEEFEKVADEARLRELYMAMEKDFIEKKSLCQLVVWGVLLNKLILYNASTQNSFFQQSKKLLSQYGFLNISIVLGNSELETYFESYYKEQKLLDILMERIRNIQNDEEFIKYLSYAFFASIDSRDPNAPKPPPEKISSNHVVLIAHLNYIIASIFSVLRTFKCLGIDKENEYDNFIEKYRCILEGKNISCLGGGFTYLEALLKSVSENKEEVNLSNYSEFFKKLEKAEIKNVGFIKSNCPSGESKCKVLDSREIGEAKKNEFCSKIIDMNIYKGISDSCVTPFKQCSDDKCGGSNKPILCYARNKTLSTKKCCLECKESEVPTVVGEECDCSAYTNLSLRQQCEICITAGPILSPIFNVYRSIPTFKDNLTQFCSYIKEDMNPSCCILPVCTASESLFQRYFNFLESKERIITAAEVFSELKNYPDLLNYASATLCPLSK